MSRQKRIDAKPKTMRALLSAVALLGICALPAAAQASPTPAPAWKVLAVTGPTNLPPKQSETQRVTVEAQGGDFSLSLKLGEGTGTETTENGLLTLEKDNHTAIAVSGTYAVGERVTGAGLPAETLITAVSGSEVTLSNAPESPPTGTAIRVVKIFTKTLTGVTGGPYHVGDLLTGSGLAPHTRVTSVGSGTLGISRASDSTYVSGQLSFTFSALTEPTPYDASAEALQSAFDALPNFAPGTFSVSGGPGGDASHPYFVAFGGELAEQDVQQLTADSSELTGEHAFAQVLTTVPGGPGSGEIVVYPTNMGGAESSGTVTATIGPLPTGVLFSGPAKANEWVCTGGAGESTIVCTTTRNFQATHSSTAFISAPVEVGATAAPSASAPVTISGGGAAAPDTYQLPIVVSTQPAPFGVAASWAGSFEADGSPSTQAGGHPYSGGAEFIVNTVRSRSGQVIPAADPRDVIVDLPPGFVGNPLAGPRCPQGNVLCDEEKTVGYLAPFVGSLSASLDFPSRLYNDHPPEGYAAEFSAKIAFPLQSVLGSVNSEEDFGIRLTAPNNANYYKIYGAFSAFEGVPVEGNGQALLTNPTNCAESVAHAPQVIAKADPWSEVGHFSEPVTLPQPALVNCEALELNAYDPSTKEGQASFTFRPYDSNGVQVSQGSTPVGATAHLHLDQSGLTDPKALATPELKRSVIKLPAGMSLNPSSANGLEGCSEAEIGFKGGNYPMPNPLRFTEAQPQCPDASKIGTVEVKTPVLDNPLVGEIFLANQNENPFGSLIAIYLVVNDPYTGVLVKLPGEVRLDPNTGRLTAIFDNAPQLPFDDLILKFRGGGPRSLFATSEVCGPSGAQGEWTPWSAPESGPPAKTHDSFEISSNCSASSSARPFAPSLEAGTTDPTAGSYSPLIVKVGRKDGEQEISHLDFTLPAGLTGKVAGIPYCSEDQIAQARAKSGKAEQAGPSCPSASEIGTVDAASGVGTEPIHVGGKLYLAGPYEGAPMSAVAITPAVAGPYDLGDVVIRTPLFLDPVTAQLTAKSDEIPRILQGIPLKIRDVAISVGRQGFILNPTSCEAASVSASLSSTEGATANPANRFQVGGCANLGFGPKLSARLKGGTKRGDHPAFTTTLTYPQGAYANLRRIAVTLPHAEFLENAHIGTVCTRVQFAAKACPKGSIYGKITAWSPLLDHPLTGFAYLRSSSNKLPDMVLALHGPPSQPIEIDLDGRIDSIRGGIRTTFEAVPDAPVSKVVLSMFGGKKGLLVNSRNLCKAGGGRMTIKMAAHNNRISNIHPALKNQCKKHKRRKSHRNHHRAGTRAH